MGKTRRLLWLPLTLTGIVLLALMGWLAAVNVAQAAVSSVSIDSATVAPGGSAAVNVTAVATTPGIGAYTIDVVYDDSLVTATACTSNPAGLCNAAFAPNTVRFTGFSVTGLTGTVNIGTITFQAGSTTGVANLDVQVVQLADPTGSEITPGAVNDGTFTIQVQPTPTPTPPPGATPTPTPPPGATPTPTPAPAALPPTGGEPSDGGPSARPWLAAIAGAIALIGSGSAWFAYQRRRVR